MGYALVTAFRASGREDALAEGGRQLYRVDCERESSSSLDEPANVSATALAVSEVQLEGTPLTAAERIRGIERCCVVRIEGQVRSGARVSGLCGG